MLFQFALRIVLLIASIHSVILGVAICFFTNSMFRFLGLKPLTELFYPQQNGVMLIIMGVAYGIAAIDLNKHKDMVFFTILSKGCAVVFLFYYALFKSAPLAIFGSGIGDGLYFLILLILAVIVYRESRKEV